MNIGDLIFRALIDDKAFDAHLQKTAQKSGDKAAKTLGAKISGGLKQSFQQGLGMGAGIGAIQVAGQAIHAATDFIFDAIDASSNLAEATSKAGVVFEKSTPKVMAWGKAAATSIGMSERAALEASGTIGNLLLSMGKTPEVAAEMSMTMVNLAADLASFNNVDVEEVLMAMRSGLTGEIAPLRRFGVNLTDVTLKQKAMNLGLYDGSGLMDVNAKSAAAYALILEQTTTAQGDFARTSEGMANQQRILAALAEDTSAKFGEVLLPIVIEFQQTVIKALDSASLALEDFEEAGRKGSESARLHFNAMGGSAELWRRQMHDAADRTKDDLVVIEDELGNLSTAAKLSNDIVLLTFQKMRDGIRNLESAFRTSAMNIIGDYYDPIEARQEQLSLKQEAAEQRAIIASKNSTKEQVADARLRLQEIERRSLELLVSLGSTGTATQKEISTAITVWQKKARTAKGAALADINAIIRQLMLLRLAALQASGALKGNVGLTPGGGGGRATGGPVKAGVSYEVNERPGQREFFVPNTDGHIYPSAQAVPSGAMGGPTYQTTINYPDPSRGPEDFSRALRRAATLG